MLDLGLILPAKSLGILRLSDEPGCLALPLQKNTNDKATIFAGSIFSLAALSGYDTVFDKRAERGLTGDLFLLSSTIRYHSPAVSDIVAKSRITGDFALTKRGNFRMSVHVEVFDINSEQLCAAFDGVYVIKTDGP
jgi:thioesterase domain-containing protein